jgi:hypothetical protein
MQIILLQVAMFKLNLASVRIDPDVSAGVLADLSEGLF